jgi:hypothetical protein
MDASFMKFVEDDGAKSRQERILLKPRREDAFGSDQQAGVGGKATLESNLPANFPSDRPTALGGNAMSDRAGSSTTRLQQQHGATLDQRWWNARRLAGTRIGDNDDRTMAFKRRRDL